MLVEMRVDDCRPAMATVNGTLLISMLYEPKRFVVYLDVDRRADRSDMILKDKEYPRLTLQLQLAALYVVWSVIVVTRRYRESRKVH
jgi:hypothetical protein